MTAVTRKNPKRSIIELHFENEGGQVRIVPPDQDIMALPVEVAIEACRAFNNQIRFASQFDQLLQRVGEWVLERRALVSEAFITTRDAGLLLLVVMKGREYSGELEDALTEFDLEIANDADYNLICLSALALPQSAEHEFETFLSKLRVRYNLNAE